MYRVTRAESFANATLIRLNAERGVQLEELCRQTSILVDRFKGRIIQKTTEAM